MADSEEEIPAVDNDTPAETWLLVSDELEAQKLILTWPTAYQKWDGDDQEDLLDIWESISGIEEQRIRHFYPVLFENRILNSDGTQSARIMGLIRAGMAHQLRRAGK